MVQSAYGSRWDTLLSGDPPSWLSSAAAGVAPVTAVNRSAALATAVTDGKTRMRDLLRASAAGVRAAGIGAAWGAEGIPERGGGTTPPDPLRCPGRRS